MKSESRGLPAKGRLGFLSRYRRNWMNQESDTLEFFGPLLTDPSKIKREAVHRRKQFDEKSILAEEIPAYEADSWQVDR
jgi:putative ubiquitin-RnfH superfamily antitoxin RatB of RatAB toxin-antitoxin module